MNIRHNGVVLNQEQLDAVLPVLNASMKGHYPTKKKLNAALDQALQLAGCPAGLEASGVAPAVDAGCPVSKS